VMASPIRTMRNPHRLSHLVYRRNPKEKKEAKEAKEPDTTQKQQSTLKVTDQYIALLIRVFVAAGLLDVSANVLLGILGPPLMIVKLLGAFIDVRGKYHRHEPL
jgi:hypothetical protein